jgi:hypothetical protein
VGAWVGKAIARPIPLFPIWIGSLGSAGTLAVIFTLRDSRGDLFRFIGGSLTNSLFGFISAAKEVELTRKTTTVSGRFRRFLTRQDKKFHILPRIQSMFGGVVNAVQRIKSDMAEQ